MFADDYDSFIDDTEGVSACVFGGDEFNARFMKQWVELNIGRTPFSGVAPTIEGKYSDLTGHSGQTGTVDGTIYRIVDIQPVSRFWATAILEAV